MQQRNSFQSYWMLALVLILGLGLTLAVTTVVAAPPGASPAAAGATTYRVAKTGDGSDGLTWATAFTDVQDALTATIAGDEIWVATGVYTPGTIPHYAFQLVSGVGMYGGFAGGETQRGQRDWEANVTVLSGDLEGNDNTTDEHGVVTNPGGIQGSNSQTVVKGNSLAASTTLDGFAITAGDGIGSGGGIYLNDSSPEMRNLVFSANRSTQDGGALHNTGTSSPTLTHVQFVNNLTSAGRGGAVANDHNDASLTLVDAMFRGNTAQAGTHGGGGIFVHHGEVHVISSTFGDNSADLHGGAIYNLYGTLRVDSSTFSDNYATVNGSGGAIYNQSALEVIGCTFTGNEATSHHTNGGAIVNTSSTLAAGPTAPARGGSIHSPQSTASIANSTFYGNKAAEDGGAILSSAPLTLTNCTLSHNSAGLDGGGLYNESTLHLINTIMANSEADYDCYNTVGDTIATNINNLIESNAPHHSMCGTPALTDDPKLSPLADNGGETQTMALNSDSPALDAGNDAACAASPVDNLDQRGVARPQGDHCDIGAYEAVQTVRCYVHNDDTSADYDSFDAVAVQEAVDEASDGHLLKVAGYCQGVELSGSTYQTVHITKSLTLQGGYTHTNWLTAPDLDTYRTTLDANHSGRVALVSNTLGVTLSHLVMTKGKTADEGNDGHGGGIYSEGSLALDHCVIISNATGYESAEFGQGGYGAGVCSLGTLSVYYSTITANTAGHGSTGGHGGGVYVSGTLTLDHSTVSDNSAGAGASGVVGGNGGGIYARGSGSIEHSTISGNATGSGEGPGGQSGHGGGVYNEATLTIHNSTISGNATAECFGDCGGRGGDGGGIYNTGMMTLTHATVAYNTASAGNGGSGDAGGIYVSSGLVYFQNSIVAENVEAGDYFNDCAGTLTSLDYNLIGDTTGCTIDGTVDHNLVDQSPLLLPLADNGGPAAPLAGEPTWTQALQPDSPALDTIPNGTSGCGTTFSDDQRDLPRPQPADGSCDIGAVEMQDQTLTVIPSGDGSGSVSSDPAGIDCASDGGDCYESYPYGTVVTLTHAADTGSTFSDWSGGGCTGAGECQVLMDQAREVTATFALDQIPLSVTITGPGSGAVTSQPPGIDCNTGTCQADFGYSNTVTLTAAAGAGSVLDAWSGDCTGDADVCVVTMLAPIHVTATFTLGEYEAYLPFVAK